MTSQTKLSTIRHPATHLATGTFAALLLVAFAQPATASDANAQVGPEPHWSSRIGTGQLVVTESRQPQAAITASRGDAPASAHWSAGIGTGRVVVESRSAPAASNGVAAPPTHWSALIGTGHASAGTDVRKLAEHTAPVEAIRRTQVDDKKRLGEHPAMLVARSWSSRPIDPNTFIVLHPAATAAESATFDQPRTVTVASVSNR